MNAVSKRPVREGLISTLVLIALAAAFPGLASTSGTGGRRGVIAASTSARNPYVLVRGNMSTNYSIELVEELLDRYSGDFLWFRKGGKAYVVRDEPLLDRAERLFDPLKSLQPERRKLEERQRAVEREEQAVDRERDELDDSPDADGDEDGDEDDAPTAPDPALDRRRAELDRRAGEIAARERALDREDRALDLREDALQEKAESALRELIDEILRGGLAQPAD